MEVPNLLEQLYDIYEPWYKPFWNKTVFIILIFSLLALLITYFALRKKKKNFTFEEKILIELNNLKVNTKDYKKFYFNLSDILKKYLSFRYNLNLSSKTDEEVLLELKDSGFPSIWLDKLKNIFMGAITIKFAKEESSKAKMEHDLNDSILLTKETLKINK